ncbi:Gfo/Idh/MocA family oxidoreductase [Candidatus Poribacteria bacterium]|nr:Gfo/Idh/MocA family oxidoreductase [Candidatus Poribacteria bacterium]MYG06294.1 Gfo/Idh/MocA family oxidoreductase [Candidatus Poribacteria bacterium]MYK22736.1 Gfo/Idh/MocA family oxidoreductase [Candidatus Poribacteria bacterium]
MKIAFIGVGGIAGNYRRSLNQLERPIAAVCDINAERAAAIATEENAVAYTDHTEMLQKETPDVVFTCIPPGAHTTQVADAAASGAALFVAKPVAQDLETAERARDAIATAGVINQVGYMARYSDITAKAKALVGDRKLAMGFGRFLARMGATHPWWGKYEVSRGQMVEQTTHIFDLIRYFLGDVANVHAYGIKGVSEDIADFEECTVCNLQFESGAVGNITSTCVARAHDNFATELVGDDIYLKLTHDLGLRGQIGGEGIDYTGTEAGYFRQVEQFIKAVDANDQGLVLSPYADAAKSLAVTLAANRSLETGQVEQVPE